MRRLKNKLLFHAKSFRSALQNKPLKSSFLHHDMPYFSQWESRDLVKKIVLGQLKAADDPRWKESGAKNRDEYTSWSWSCCGMACLKMILAHKQKRVIPLVTLGKKCMEYGGYALPLETSPGLYYKPFVTFIKQEFSLKGKAVAALTLSEIKHTLASGGYAIVSVTPEIRHPHIKPKKRGGHLVLLFGYDDAKQIIYLNNPSGFKDSQERVAVPYNQFMSFFDRKGILINA